MSHLHCSDKWKLGVSGPVRVVAILGPVRNDKNHGQSQGQINRIIVAKIHIEQT